MPVWTPTQNWDRLYIRTFNTLAQKSWGRIDNICVQEVNRPCCTDEEEFVANMRNAVTFSFDESTQEGICTIGNLPECDSIAFIDWGDGHIDVGPFGGNTVRRNKFLDHLLARIQFQGYEYNAEIEPDETCFDHLFEDSLDVYSLDTCLCNSFAEVFIRGPRGEYSQLVDCGEPPFALTCLPAGESYTVTGLINCTGDQCADETVIEWTLNGPGGTNSGTSYANPYFTITLPPAYVAQPGLYTLSLNGQCGIQGCPCEIQFTVDCPSPCPCTPEAIAEFRKERDTLLAQIDALCERLRRRVPQDVAPLHVLGHHVIEIRFRCAQRCFTGQLPEGGRAQAGLREFHRGLQQLGVARDEGAHARAAHAVALAHAVDEHRVLIEACLLYTSPSPRDGLLSRMPSSA